MEKFTVYIDMDIEEIRRGYKNYFGTDKKPTRKDIASLISILASADIMDAASHEIDDDNNDSSLN